MLITIVPSIPAFRQPLLSEELGYSPTLSLLFGKHFTLIHYNWELGTDETFPRFREAELKHGRIYMAANLGVIVPPTIESIMQVDMDENDIVSSTATTTTETVHLPNASILNNLSSVTPFQFLNMVVTCAFLEFFIFFQRDEKDMPGDYGTGCFGVRDKCLQRRSLVSELENGRLAMLAIAGQIAAELVSGQSWWEQWKDSFRKVVNQLVEWSEGVSLMIDAPVYDQIP